MSKVPTSSAYQTLTRFIKIEIANSKKKIEHTKITAYWRIGQAISRHLLDNKHRAGYGEHLFDRLSRDLNVGERTLQRTVQFYREFPIPSAQTELQWNHYQLLLTIKDDDKRLEWQKHAIQKGLSARELKKQIKLKALKTKKPAPKKPAEIVKLAVERGELNTYAIIGSENIKTDKDTLLADLGFNIWRRISKKSHESRAASNEIHYTYKAYVEEVIDGDTLWCLIDVGFNNFTRQKLRLCSIDCPEMTAQKGQKAKAFVKKILEECEFIIVKTKKSDMYDRYLADIFYDCNETDPARVAQNAPLLNQTLLDKGLAVVWDG